MDKRLEFIRTYIPLRNDNPNDFLDQFSRFLAGYLNIDAPNVGGGIVFSHLNALALKHFDNKDYFNLLNSIVGVTCQYKSKLTLDQINLLMSKYLRNVELKK